MMPSATIKGGMNPRSKPCSPPGSASDSNSGHAETQAVAPIARRVSGPVRPPDTAGVVVPAPPADHPFRCLGWAGRIVNRRPAIIFGVVSVRAPLIDVAVHVVEAPGVGPQLTDRRRV